MLLTGNPKLELLNKVFRPRIKTLNAADWKPQNVRGMIVPPRNS